MKIDLSTLKGAELVSINNALAETPVKKFASNEAGVTAVTTLLETMSKGKENKAKLQVAISSFKLSILLILATAISFAKDLAIKVRPAHQRILKVMLDAGADKKKIHYDKLAKLLGVASDNARLAEVLGEIYGLNLILWEEDGSLMLMDAATNFVNANGDDFDMEADFEALEFTAPKKGRVSTSDGSSRSRIPDTAILNLVKKDNPCNPTKERYKHFEAITDGGTVKQYKDAGGNAFNLGFFIGKGYVTVA